MANYVTINGCQKISVSSDHEAFREHRTCQTSYGKEAKLGSTIQGVEASLRFHRILSKEEFPVGCLLTRGIS